jgi:hypothetical protein
MAEQQVASPGRATFSYANNPIRNRIPSAKTERKGHKLKRKDDHGTFATLAKP